jgi:hypothetical protein
MRDANDSVATDLECCGTRSAAPLTDADTNSLLRGNHAIVR